MKKIIVRPLEKQDKQKTLSAFQELRPVLASTTNNFIYRALISDALSEKDVVIFLAQLEQDILGYVIAAKNWKSFKKSFYRRHPLVSGVAILKRLKAYFSKKRQKKLRQSQKNTSAPGVHQSETFSHPHIIHVGVKKEARGQGVGTRLYDQIAEHFKRLNYLKITAHIDKENTSSIQLHKRSGWVLKESNSGLQASLTLKRTQI